MTAASIDLKHNLLSNSNYPLFEEKKQNNCKTLHNGTQCEIDVVDLLPCTSTSSSP